MSPKTDEKLLNLTSFLVIKKKKAVIKTKNDRSSCLESKIRITYSKIYKGQLVAEMRGSLGIIQ